MKSWKTTLTGILTILAALSSAGINYLQHGQLPDFAQLIPMLIAGAGLISAKDHDVTTPPAIKPPPYIPLIAAIMIPVMFASCSTVPTGNPITDRRNRVANALLTVAGKAIGKAAVNTLLNVVKEQASGDKIDFADAAAQGAWASAGSIVNSSDMEAIINAWSGNTMPAVAKAAGVQFDQAIANGVSSTMAANAIASTVSAGALQATK